MPMGAPLSLFTLYLFTLPSLVRTRVSLALATQRLLQQQPPIHPGEFLMHLR